MKVRSHAKRSKKGKRFTVRKHSRVGKPSAIARMQKRYPDFSKQKAGELYEDVFDSLKTDLKKQGRVPVRDFGIFRVKRTKAKPRRQVRNPFTGTTVWAKPKKAGKKIVFRVSKNLK